MRKFVAPVVVIIFLAVLFSAMIGPVKKIEKQETTGGFVSADIKNAPKNEHPEDDEAENLMQRLIDESENEIYITEDIAVDQAFYLPSEKTITIAGGAKMTVDAEAACMVEGKVINNGTLVVNSEMDFYQDLVNYGTITVGSGGFPIRVIKEIEREDILDEIEAIFSGKTPIKNVLLAPDDAARFLIDRDFTIPKGCGLWTGLYATVEVVKGVEFTVSGEFNPYTEVVADVEVGDDLPPRNPAQK